MAVADTATFNACVVDDEYGQPIKDVLVEASFSNDNGWKAWTESAPIFRDRKKTGLDGFCRLSGKTNIGRAGCWVDAPPSGYYRAGGRSFRFQKKDLFGVWQPDNLVATIRLQRVGRPIPLRVKRVGDHINRSRVGYVDGTNAVFRFDLVMGDYLPPDGRGEVADLVFDSRLTDLTTTNVHRRARVFYGFENVVSFPGEGNGLVPVATRPTDGIRLRTAPETGYRPTAVLRCGSRMKVVPPNVLNEPYGDSDPDRCYYFRVRARHDAQGRLVSCHYGKIYGDFKIGCWLREGGCSVEFLYYLNPVSLDRNLEWDRKNNLCPNPGRLGERRP